MYHLLHGNVKFYRNNNLQALFQKYIFSITKDVTLTLNPVSEGNHYIYLTLDHFSIYIVTVPTPKNFAHYAVNSIFHYWISKFGPAQYPLNPVSDGRHHIYVIVSHFSKSIVTVPTPKKCSLCSKRISSALDIRFWSFALSVYRERKRISQE